jgi:creatinine amidohydrolase
MRILTAVAITVLLGVSALAQSRSVWIEDYTGEEVVSLVGAGKTTLIYCGGALHADGPAIAVGKHMRVGRVVAQRIAEELGNALVLPTNPYVEASAQMARASTSGTVIGGTISLSPETYALVTKDVVNTALLAVRGSDGLAGTGFKTVFIMGDHSQGQDTLERVAKDLDREWRAKGVRVHYIDVARSGKAMMEDYLGKLNQNIPRQRMTPIDDAAELMSVDPDRRWVREDKIPSDERKLVSATLGKTFVDFKVNSALQQIRKLTAAPANQ